jgi:hypothetical protein
VRKRAEKHDAHAERDETGELTPERFHHGRFARRRAGQRLGPGLPESCEAQ